MIVRVKSTGNTELWIEHTPDSNTKYKVELISEGTLGEVLRDLEVNCYPTAFDTGVNDYIALLNSNRGRFIPVPRTHGDNLRNVLHR